MDYYYLMISLPKIFFGEAPPLSIDDLKFALESNLTPQDKKEVQRLFLKIDLENLRHYWLGKALNPLGNWDRYQIETILVQSELQPKYLSHFLEKFTTQEERLSHFSILLKDFYINEGLKGIPFLRFYFSLLDYIREVGSALRKKIPLEYIEFKNPAFSSVTTDTDNYPDSIKELDGKDVEKELQKLLSENKNNPLLINEAYNHFIFNAVDLYTEMDFFNLEALLCYLVQYSIVYSARLKSGSFNYAETT